MNNSRQETPVNETASGCSIQVSVVNDTAAPIDLSLLEASVCAALTDSRYASAIVSVAVVDDATIQDLNRRFLNHDYPTDVLSFSLEDEPPHLYGEIVVSVETAQRFAAKAGWSTSHELALYVVHGALHLMGHCDEDAQDDAEMRCAELKSLRALGISPSAADSRWADGPPMREGDLL